jgi:putative addiction module component (TIGR02574 family)
MTATSGGYTGIGVVNASFPSELLKLPAGERAELAMALWESLSVAEREGELTPEERAELVRRWMEHVQRPESSIPWDEVRRKLTDRE